MTKIISSLICSCNSSRVDDCVLCVSVSLRIVIHRGKFKDIESMYQNAKKPFVLSGSIAEYWQMKGKQCHNIYCAQTTTMLLLSAAAWCKAHHKNIHRASSHKERERIHFSFFPPLNTAVRFHETIILYVKVNCGCDSSEWAKQYMVECRVSEWVERKRKIKSYRNSTEKLFPTTTTTVILCAAEWEG